MGEFGVDAFGLLRNGQPWLFRLEFAVLLAMEFGLGIAGIRVSWVRVSWLWERVLERIRVWRRELVGNISLGWGAFGQWRDFWIAGAAFHQHWQQLLLQR
jgi:hypothetical protein